MGVFQPTCFQHGVFQIGTIYDTQCTIDAIYAPAYTMQAYESLPQSGDIITGRHRRQIAVTGTLNSVSSVTTTFTRNSQITA